MVDERIPWIHCDRLVQQSQGAGRVVFLASARRARLFGEEDGVGDEIPDGMSASGIGELTSRAGDSARRLTNQRVAASGHNRVRDAAAYRYRVACGAADIDLQARAHALVFQVTR
jgi:hypothetical protein